MTSPNFTHVYAALVAVLNTKVRREGRGGEREGRLNQASVHADSGDWRVDFEAFYYAVSKGV